MGIIKAAAVPIAPLLVCLFNRRKYRLTKYRLTIARHPVA
jgi:hypothetical protein